MLTPEYLSTSTDCIEEFYAELESRLLDDIGAQMSEVDYEAAVEEYYAQRNTALARHEEYTDNEINKALVAGGLLILNAVRQSGRKSWANEYDLYNRAYADGQTSSDPETAIPYNRVQSYAERAAESIISGVNTATRSAGRQSGKMLEDAIVAARDGILGGKLTYDQAVRQAVKRAAAQGINVLTYSTARGRRREQLDVFARRNVLGAMTAVTGSITMRNLSLMGTDLVQVSAHAGARKSHEAWQGGIYSLTGSSHDGNFYDVTGYGTVEGLHGVNCYHDFYPYFDGLSVNLYTDEYLDKYADATVEYNGQEFTTYDALQRQRTMERTIRKWKREESALTSAGVDHAYETDKRRAWQAALNDFTKQTGLTRQYAREQA